MWSLGLTLVMTLTLDFQGQILVMDSDYYKSMALCKTNALFH